ncbi:hypothetical protein MRV_0025 [Murid herpesvirus 3]|uniref:Uncharacterized protein n=2 Tax=Murid betaherpesvirus 3 TaxID=2560603 RepID=A0A1P8VIQ4_9BETA|nr:hypothetical protein MRV_0025 [Murine roseolovirus]APZ76236.1 hypothetical protein MRV_0025 [Murid betaherpesvirus 3]AYH64761.1 hypothetical protein MRV_0025 [Murid herpesvirus 3]
MIPCSAEELTGLTRPIGRPVTAMTLVNIYDSELPSFVGQQFDITWPPLMVLTIGNFENFGSKKKLQDYLEDPLARPGEEIISIGYIHPLYRFPNIDFDLFLFYTSNRRVLALDPIENKLCFVAETPLHFSVIQCMNISYYFNIHLPFDIESSWFRRIETDREALVMYQRNLDRFHEYVKYNSGKSKKVNAFSANILHLCTRHDIYSLVNKGIMESLNTNYSLFGVLGGENTEPNCKIPIFIDRNCAIHVFWNRQLFKIAPTVRYFLRMGLSEFKAKRSQGVAIDSEVTFSRNDIVPDQEVPSAITSVKLRKRPQHHSSRNDR